MAKINLEYYDNTVYIIADSVKWQLNNYPLLDIKERITFDSVDKILEDDTFIMIKRALHTTQRYQSLHVKRVSPLYLEEWDYDDLCAGICRKRQVFWTRILLHSKLLSHLASTASTASTLSRITFSNCKLMRSCLKVLAEMAALKCLCFHDVYLHESTAVAYEPDELKMFAEKVSNLDSLGISEIPLQLLTCINNARTFPFHTYINMPNHRVFSAQSEWFGPFEQFVCRNTKLALQLFIIRPSIIESWDPHAMQRLVKLCAANVEFLEIHSRIDTLPITFAQLLPCFSALRVLKICGATELLEDGDLLMIARRTPGLEVLHLGKSCLNLSEDYGYLSQYWTNLVDIALTRSSISGVNLYALAVASSSKLRRIFLEKCPAIDLKRRDLALESSICVRLSLACPFLESLVVRFCRVHMDSSTTVSFLGNSARLRYLLLEGRDVCISTDCLLTLRKKYGSSNVRLSGGTGLHRRGVTIWTRLELFCGEPDQSICERVVPIYCCCPICKEKVVPD